MQDEYTGVHSIENLREIFLIQNAAKVFLVTGRKSFGLSGAENFFKKLSEEFEFIQYNDFSENPKYEELEKGINLFRDSDCDIIVAAGGGSVIDTAKLINTLSAQEKDPAKYITGEEVISNKGKHFTAIPTTSGAGSEATHFAVVYMDMEKFSLAHEFILPDAVIIDPQLTYSLSPRHTALSGIDAFSQAVESFWSVNSTDVSRTFAEEAIKLITGNLNKAVNNPDPECRISMSTAANLAGKAINITKTTAPHAVSYSMTSHYGVPHGQAVSYTLGDFLVYNYNVNEDDINDKRGVSFVKKTFEELLKILGCKSVYEGREKIKQLMTGINLKTNLKDYGISSEEDIRFIADNVNTERLGNNPRSLTNYELLSILRNNL